MRESSVDAVPVDEMSSSSIAPVGLSRESAIFDVKVCRFGDGREDW